MLRPLVDDIVCLPIPDPFAAIGSFYLDFQQLSDREVVQFLSEVGAHRRDITGRNDAPHACPGIAG